MQGDLLLIVLGLTVILFLPLVGLGRLLSPPFQPSPVCWARLLQEGILVATQELAVGLHQPAASFQRLRKDVSCPQMLQENCALRGKSLQLDYLAYVIGH